MEDTALYPVDGAEIWAARIFKVVTTSPVRANGRNRHRRLFTLPSYLLPAPIPIVLGAGIGSALFKQRLILSLECFSVDLTQHVLLE